MPTSPFTRFFFAYLIPGSTLVCALLFLVDVPGEEGYRISLLEWGLESDRVFPYVVALGLVASAVLGSLVQGVRLLVVDAWALPRRRPAAAPLGPAPDPAATDGPPGNPAPSPLPPASGGGSGRRGRLGPLGELHGNLGLALLFVVIWIAAKIIRGGGTEVFPRRVAYGVPLVGLAACALLFGAYRQAGGRGPEVGDRAETDD